MNEYYKATKYGFSYPSEYEELIAKYEGEFGDLQWWFIGSSEGLFDVAYELVNKELGSKIELFPFAKSSETNSLACFDNGGKVYFVIGTISLKNADWSKRLTASNISAWFEGVMSGEF